MDINTCVVTQVLMSTVLLHNTTHTAKATLSSQKQTVRTPPQTRVLVIQVVNNTQPRYIDTLRKCAGSTTIPPSGNLFLDDHCGQQTARWATKRARSRRVHG